MPLYPETKIMTGFGEITVGVTSETAAYVNGQLTYRDRVWNINGHFKNMAMIGVGQIVAKQLGNYPSIKDDNKVNTDAPPTFRDKIMEVILDAWHVYVAISGDVIEQGTMQNLKRDLATARAKATKFYEELMRENAEIARLLVEIRKRQTTTCVDHWHCVPELAAHLCDKPNRSKPCPTCNEEPI